MLSDYLPILFQVLIAFGFAAVVLVVSVLAGRAAKSNKMKDSAYECGMLPVGDGQPRFSVKFYLIAMLFVLFDIEVVFLYPWAIQFNALIQGSSVPFWSALSFVAILAVAYVYVLRKKALDWNEA